MPKSALEKLNHQILSCAYCLKHARGKLVPGEGSGKTRIMFVGEAPGKTESETGRPFVGRAGKLLEQMLEQIGLSREDVFITSALKYLPIDYVTPKSTDIEHGRIHLQEQIKVLKPKLVVLLGAYAVLSVLQKKIVISEKHGTVKEIDGVSYFYCYHPAAPLHNPKLRSELQKDFKKLGQVYEK